MVSKSVPELAAEADFLALTAFEFGLFGWMAITQLILFPPLTCPPAVPRSGS
jgi:hypothetical protein